MISFEGQEEPIIPCIPLSVLEERDPKFGNVKDYLTLIANRVNGNTSRDEIWYMLWCDAHKSLHGTPRNKVRRIIADDQFSDTVYELFKFQFPEYPALPDGL